MFLLTVLWALHQYHCQQASAFRFVDCTESLIVCLSQIVIIQQEDMQLLHDMQVTQVKQVMQIM